MVSGYGIMQPRVTIALPKLGRGSLFQQIFATRPGIDPYVFATSDVYQDLFGEGTFTGKGIYDVDAFMAALRDRIPDNTLLSHDLLEGNFARAGLVSDVQVAEEYPESYLVDSARHHRWARGDWQLLPWMIPPARGLTGLGLWMMADNLRRTLTAPVTLVAFFAGWTLLPPAMLQPGRCSSSLCCSYCASSDLRRQQSAARTSTPKSQILTLRDGHRKCSGSDRSAAGPACSSVLGHARRNWPYPLSALHQQAETSGMDRLRANPVRAKGVPWRHHRAMASSVALGGLVLAGVILPFGGVSVAAVPLAVAWCLAPTFAFLISMPPHGRSEQTISPDVAASCARLHCGLGVTSIFMSVLKTTRSHRITFRKIGSDDRPPYVSDQHWSLSSLDGECLRDGLDRDRRGGQPNCRKPWPPYRSSIPIVAICSTGMTPARSRRWNRVMSRPWTAATWRRT